MQKENGVCGIDFVIFRWDFNGMFISKLPHCVLRNVQSYLEQLDSVPGESEGHRVMLYSFQLELFSKS